MNPVEDLSPSSAGDIASADSFPDEWFSQVSEDHFWFAWRYRAFQRQLRALDLPTATPLTGLDIGCGNGLTRAQLERDTAWTVDGADLNRPVLAQCPRGRGRTLFYNIHDRLPDLRARYDFLVLFDVLEHIDQPVPFLASALHHLKPGGWIFLNVPALEQVRSVFDRVVGHVRRYDQPLMRSELGAAGLEPVDLRYWGLANVPLLWLRKHLLARTRLPPAEILRTGLQPPGRLANAVLRGVMRAETALLAKPPLGSSLLAAARLPG